MKAIQLVAPQELILTDVPSRSLKNNEVRIKVHCSSVCGTDLRNVNAPATLPQIPGHEFSGEIVEVFNTDSAVHVGDRVTVFPMMTCMACDDCRSGHFRDCENKKGLGVDLPGSFAEEIIVDGRLVIPLFDEISFADGALLEHLCCGHRLMKEVEADTSGPKDQHILILGDGPIALADVQSFVAAGYSNVTLIGKHANRMSLAQAFGAKHVLDVNNLSGLDLTPIDVCIFAAPADQTLIDILSYIKEDGILYPQVRLRSEKLLQQIKNQNVKLGRAFAYYMEDFKEVMALISDKRINTKALITKKYSLKEAAEEFEDFFDKSKNCKVLINSI